MANSTAARESFTLFAPTHDRQYCPVLGVRNLLSSFEKSNDGKSLKLVWSDLESEYEGRLDITLRGTVSLRGDTVEFDMTIVNHSPEVISSVSWPILGSVAEPAAVMKLSTPNYGGMSVAPLWNPFAQNAGYFIAVDQDPAGIPGHRVSQVGPLEVWTKPLGDGSKAVGLFNKEQGTLPITVYFRDIGLSKTNCVRDLWAKKDLGRFEGC